MDQMVRNDIACNCIPIVRIAFQYAHISFNCFFEDFNCVFTQIRCLSRVLGLNKLPFDFVKIPPTLPKFASSEANSIQSSSQI